MGKKTAYRRLRLFVLIAFRVWERQSECVIRLWPRLAWKVAVITYPEVRR